MMYDNIFVTVYGALDHVHIFSDVRLVNVYQMTQMRAKPTAWAPLRTTIDTGRSRGSLMLYIRALKYVGLSDLL